jgi:hypothetical protein
MGNTISSQATDSTKQQLTAMRYTESIYHQYKGLTSYAIS